MMAALWDLLNTTYIYIALVTFALSYFALAAVQRKRLNYPPGPKGWPLIGYLKFVCPDMPGIIEKLSGKSPVLMFPVGDENVVVLDTLEAIKDALIKQGNYLTGSPRNFKLGGYIVDFTGIIMEEGEHWRHQRRVVINLLKDFGVGKTALENKVTQECENLVKEIKKLDGKPFFPLTMLAKVSSNVISQFVFGSRFDYDDPKFSELLEITQQLDSTFGLVSYLDYFKHLHLLPKWMTGLDKIDQLRERILIYVNKRIEEHENNFDANSLNDYVDHCLHEIYERKANGTIKDDAELSSEMKRLKINAVSFFSAGSNTSALILVWYIKFIVLYPDVYKKIMIEIDSVIGRDREPSWMDRRNMPYFEAFFYEVERMADFIPVGVPHWSTEKIKVLGYDIPERSMFFSNLRRILKDPAIWGDPENFRPEHFIDEKTGKLVNNEFVYTFGLGKRLCPGQNLAKMQTFITLTTILQNFTLKQAASDNQGIQVSDGMLRLLKPYEIVAVPRKLVKS